MGCLIDTCVIISAERGIVDFSRRLKGLENETFCISTITVSELLFGVHKAPDSHARTRRKAFVEDILLKFPILPIDLPIARMHAELWAELSSTGKLIGSHDLWIAASCLACGHVLVTDNRKDFLKIKSLSIL